MQVSLNRMRAHHRGFSLIEILVVLTIIAFATKMVVYSLEGGAEDELDTQALRLHTTINMASEFAILNQIELGLMVEENTLEFLVFDGENGLPLTAKTFTSPLSWMNG